MVAAEKICRHSRKVEGKVFGVATGKFLTTRWFPLAVIHPF